MIIIMIIIISSLEGDGDTVWVVVYPFSTWSKIIINKILIRV